MSRPFTQSCLASIHLMQVGGCGLDEIAFTLGRTRQECDRAIWALLGSSIPTALASLNRPQLVGVSA